MSRQLGFLMDLQKCIGCKGCAMACKNENGLGDTDWRRVMVLTEHPQNFFGFLSMACNHCANPACMRECPKGCFKKRRDGIVLHDPSRCTGCKSCIGACPYRVPQFNPLTGKVSKCNLCFTRLEKGLKPACVEACIPEALQLIDLEGPLPENSQEALPGYFSVRLTRPSVRFILPGSNIRFWRQVMCNQEQGGREL